MKKRNKASHNKTEVEKPRKKRKDRKPKIEKSNPPPIKNACEFTEHYNKYSVFDCKEEENIKYQ